MENTKSHPLRARFFFPGGEKTLKGPGRLFPHTVHRTE